MNALPSRLIRLLFLVIGLGHFSAPLAAQTAPATALEQMVATATNHMEQQQWSEAQQQWRDIITHFGGAAASHIGPRFGAVWYQLGRCYLMQNQPKEAMEAFATCYRDYPNRGDSRDNPFQWLALQLWAETAQATAQYELALQLFYTLQRQQLKDTTLSLSAWHLNVAHCHFMLNHSSEGLENFEIALINYDAFATPPAGLAAGLRDLAAMCLRLKNEALLIDFLRKHHTLLAQIISEHPELTQELLHIAALLQPTQWWQSSLWTLSLCPSVPELDPSSPHIGIVREGEMALQLTQTLIHEQSGNRATALAIYDTLLTQQPQASQRQAWRRSARRLARDLDDTEPLRKHTFAQLQEQPAADENGQILNDWLQHLFAHGLYRECLSQDEQWHSVAALHDTQAAIRLRLRVLSHLLTGNLELAHTLLQQPIAQSAWPIDGEREWLEILLSPHQTGVADPLQQLCHKIPTWLQQHAAQLSPLQHAAVLQILCWAYLRLEEPLEARQQLQQLLSLPANELHAPAQSLLQWLQCAAGGPPAAEPFRPQSLTGDHLYLAVIQACTLPLQLSEHDLQLGTLRLQFLRELVQQQQTDALQQLANHMLQQNDLSPEERQAAEKALQTSPAPPPNSPANPPANP